MQKDVAEGLQTLGSKAKDDSSLEDKNMEDFTDHQYWKTPELYDLDELLKEQFETDEQAQSNVATAGGAGEESKKEDE